MKIQFGPGKNIYDFVYVPNLVDGHILAAEALVRAYGSPAPAPDVRVDGECFNITNDERMPFWDFQRAIAAAVGLPVKKEDIRVIPVWLALIMAAVTEWTTWAVSGGKRQPIVTRDAVRTTVMSRTLSGEKARRVLGYKPRVSLEEGVARTGKWFEEQAKADGP